MSANEFDNGGWMRDGTIQARSSNPEMEHYLIRADGSMDHRTPVPCARCSRTVLHRGDDPTNEDLAVCGKCEAEIQDEIGASE